MQLFYFYVNSAERCIITADICHIENSSPLLSPGLERLIQRWFAFEYTWLSLCLHVFWLLTQFCQYIDTINNQVEI